MSALHSESIQGTRPTERRRQLRLVTPLVDRLTGRAAAQQAREAALARVRRETLLGSTALAKQSGMYERLTRVLEGRLLGVRDDPFGYPDVTVQDHLLPARRASQAAVYGEGLIGFAQDLRTGNLRIMKLGLDQLDQPQPVQLPRTEVVLGNASGIIAPFAELDFTIANSRLAAQTAANLIFTGRALS